jgi:putative ABC transport system ATP-binding protein
MYLSMESDILMLDEPTSALDEKTGKAVMKNLSDYCRDQGRTLMVVSHDPSLVDRFAENRVILTRGENA